MLWKYTAPGFHIIHTERLTKVLLAAFSEQARALFWLGLIDQQSLTPSSWLGGYYWSPIQLRAACLLRTRRSGNNLDARRTRMITGLAGGSKKDWQFVVRCYGDQMLRLMVSYISCSVSVFGFQVEQSDMNISSLQNTKVALAWDQARSQFSQQSSFCFWFLSYQFIDKSLI